MTLEQARYAIILVLSASLAVPLLGGCSSASPPAQDAQADAVEAGPVADAPSFVRGAPAGTRLLAEWKSTEAGTGEAILSELLARGADCGDIEPETAIERVSVVWAASDLWRVEVGGSLEPGQVACLLGVGTDDDARSRDGRLEFESVEGGGTAMVTPGYAESDGQVDERLLEQFVSVYNQGHTVAALRWEPEGKPAFVAVSSEPTRSDFRFLFSDSDHLARFDETLTEFLGEAPGGGDIAHEANTSERAVSVSVGRAGLSWFVRSGLVEFFKQASGSMLPNMKVGEHIAALKQPLLLAPPDAGDVIVFDFPQESARTYLAEQPENQRACIGPQSLDATPAPRMVKRIVATGGQMVEVRENRLDVDGEPTAHDVIEKQTTGNFLYPNRAVAQETVGGRTYGVQYSGADPDFGPVEVPPEHVFVLGDNRDNSSDSRCWGPVPRARVVGRIEAVVWAQDDDGPDWYRIGELL